MQWYQAVLWHVVMPDIGPFVCLSMFIDGFLSSL